MKNIKRNKWEKAIIVFVIFAITTQIATNFTSVIVADENPNINIQNLDVSKSEVFSVTIEGVDGTTEGEIGLGEIAPISFDGYEFINATVDNAIINYIGIYDGDYYFSNIDGNNSGAYLLGDSKVKLNYKKSVVNVPITYEYDENVLNIVGDSFVNENAHAKFRIEKLLNDYEITSVKANGSTLLADADGYYYVVNDGLAKTVIIESKKVTEYTVTYNTDYVGKGIVTCNGNNDTVKSGDTWEGSIVLNYKFPDKYTLNSILLNNEYINIPDGSNDDSFTTTLANGTEVIVAHKDGITIFNDHSYNITVKNVKSNLDFVPVLYNDVYDITMTNIEGLDVYHWDGNNLDHLSKGEVIYKNDNTDYFFVKTNPGYEAELANLSGDGTKIIDKISVLKDSNMKSSAEKLGCNYVFYYSDKSIRKRTVNISSQLIEYDVTYDVKNISDDIIYNIVDNNIINVSSVEPKKSEYTFIGWKLQDNNAMYQPGDEIILNKKLANALKTNTIALKAQWVKNEDMTTASYQIKYYFQEDNNEFVENESLRRTIKNAPIGANAFLMEKDPIGEFEFDASNKNNVLSTQIRGDNHPNVLKAYYSIAKREVTYHKGDAKEGVAPVDKLNPYKKGSNAIVMGNDGNLVGDFKAEEDQSFVCWKTIDGKYYFPNDSILMNKDITLSPVFVGDLANDLVLSFTSDKNGTLEGRKNFAIPKNHTFKEVIHDSKQLPEPNAHAGYKFDGWFYEDENIATSNTDLFRKIKDWNHGGILEAKFSVDESSRHDISYKVNYYLDNDVKDFILVSDYDVPQDTTKLNVRDLDVSKNKYDGYTLDQITPNGIKNGDTIINGSAIDVYYTKDAEQWTTVTFSAGDHGMVNDEEFVIYDDVLIGKTFKNQKIEVPTIKANKGWIVSDKKWDRNVSDETEIAKDLNITAQYKEDRNNDGIADEDQYVIVTFNAGDHGNYEGEKTSVLSNLLPGDAVNTPKLDVNAGYAFIGYDKNVLSTIAKDSKKTIEYIAQYEQNPTTPGINTPDGNQPDGNTPDVNVPDTNTPVVRGPIANNAVTPVAPAPIVPEVVPNNNNNNVVVEENETPKAKVETVKNEKTPLAKSNQKWAFMNLVLVIATMLLGVWNILSKKKELDDQASKTTKRVLKIGSGLLAIISVFAFVATQNMSTTMVIFDKWSLFMVALAIVQAAFVIYVKGIKLTRKASTKEIS